MIAVYGVQMDRQQDKSKKAAIMWESNGMTVLIESAYMNKSAGTEIRMGTIFISPVHVCPDKRIAAYPYRYYSLLTILSVNCRTSKSISYQKNHTFSVCVFL